MITLLLYLVKQEGILFFVDKSVFEIVLTNAFEYVNITEFVEESGCLFVFLLVKVCREEESKFCVIA